MYGVRADTKVSAINLAEASLARVVCFLRKARNYAGKFGHDAAAPVAARQVVRRASSLRVAHTVRNDYQTWHNWGKEGGRREGQRKSDGIYITPT